MKKMIIIVVLVMISKLCFSAEIGNQFNLSSSKVIRYSSRSYKPFSLGNQFNKIIAGSTLISFATAGTAFTAYVFATPMMWFANIIGGIVSLGMLSLAPLGLGVFLLSHALYQFKKYSTILTDEYKHLFIPSYYKAYLRAAMITGIINAVSFTALIAGVAMQISACINPSELMTWGIIPDVIGGLGLVICLPIMIASLAIAHWCKCELSEITPDISLTHDDKKGFNEGYGVSVGMRVKI